MKCSKAQQQLVPYADGTLEGRRRSSLRRHLDGCGECGAEASVVERLLALLDAGVDPEMPPELEVAVMRRVRAIAEEQAQRRGVFWPASFAAGLCAAGLAAYLVLGGGGATDPEFSTTEVARGVKDPGGAASATEPGGQTSTRPEVAAAEVEALPPEIPAAEAEGGSGVLAHGSPPEDLRDALDLFVDYPIIRDLDKIERYDAIRVETGEDGNDTRGG